MVSRDSHGWGNRLVAVILCGLVSLFQVTLAQAPSSSLRPAGQANDSAQGQAESAWLVRDPTTGRLYRQQLVSRSVPTVQWETKALTQTVYEPSLQTQSVPSQETTFKPVTQYVMTSKVRGRWNPFRRTYVSYEYKPVTTWIPQQQTVNRLVTTQQWVPKQQTVYVQQPVQKLQTQQHLVQTEIPQPATSTIAYAPRRPLLTIPILAKQRVLPWTPIANRFPASSPAAGANSGLRPVATNAMANLRPTNYSAPLRTASSMMSQRDGNQAGMSATVLR